MPKIYAHLTTQERAVEITVRGDPCSIRSIAKRRGQPLVGISRELQGAVVRAPGLVPISGRPGYMSEYVPILEDEENQGLIPTAWRQTFVQIVEALKVGDFDLVR